MKKSIVAVFAYILLVGITMQNLARAEQKCDPNKPESTPASRFEINQVDGVAFDKQTKLTWKICAEGKNYLNGHCTGEAPRFTHNDALQKFGSAGDGWRLPNIDELDSIVEWRCQYPALNERIFPNSPNASFWSGSTSISNSNHAWLMFLSVGSSATFVKTNSSFVRLVRGEPWIDSLKEEERRQEKLVAQEKQAEALVVAQKKQAEALAEARNQLEAERLATQSEKDAYVTCNNKTSCDKSFSLTQIYINSMASQKIQVATDTIIETYNPTENGNIGMGAVKIPRKGSSAIIRLSVTCKIDDGGHFDKYCESKKLNIYMGFRPFVNRMLNEK